LEAAHAREVLVDSNVILDVVTEDPHWLDWSASRLEALAEDHLFVINPIIYSEVSVGFDRIEDLEEALPPEFFRRENLPWEAGFLAGKRPGGNNGTLQNGATFGSGINWGTLAAAATMITLPVLVLALVVQRHIVTGLTFGAVKQ